MMMFLLSDASKKKRYAVLAIYTTPHNHCSTPHFTEKGKLGTPTAKEWPREAIITRSSFPNFPAHSLKKFNPYLSGEALDFVHLCLRYDPKKRVGSRQALSHPYIKSSYTKSRILQPVHNNK
uniref:Protein kinase domain-containing protein n=1 Tax=Caenorhabditis tropicalis TaxID=1561998 RepID=A0A1I7V3M2_9PELO